MSNLALHDAHQQLASMHERFNALAQVAGREMPKYLKYGAGVPIAVGIAVLSAAAVAKWDVKATIASSLIAAVNWGAGMMAGENADLRIMAYSIASGLGSSAASIATYDWVTKRIAATSAPPPAV